MRASDGFLQAFRSLHLNFSRLYAAILTDSALTLPQYTLLNLLMHRGTMTMSRAAKELLITKPAVTNLADRLEKTGLLKRKPHPEDRRAFLLELLPRGRQKVQKIQEKVFSCILKTLAFFKESEQEQMMRFMNTFARHIQEDELSPKRGRS